VVWVLAGNAGPPSTAVGRAGEVSERGDDVVTSLRNKLIRCTDEQLDWRPFTGHFADWFERLIITPAFVASVDSWPGCTTSHRAEPSAIIRS